MGVLGVGDFRRYGAGTSRGGAAGDGEECS